MANDDMAKAIQKVRDIRADAEEFDGDRRGHYEALEEAEKRLVEVALKQDDTAPNPLVKPNSDLREAVARRIYEDRHKTILNVWEWEESGLDDEHPGAREGYYRDADAAIAVVVERCAAQIECLLPEQGAGEPQDATDRLIDVTRREDARAVRALARKEG